MRTRSEILPWLLLATALPCQSPATIGDLDKIEWLRPYVKAQKLAEQNGRVLLVKPIMGGSNTPQPDGVPCGGVHDCEGSW